MKKQNKLTGIIIFLALLSPVLIFINVIQFISNNRLYSICRLTLISYEFTSLKFKNEKKKSI